MGIRNLAEKYDYFLFDCDGVLVFPVTEFIVL